MSGSKRAWEEGNAGRKKVHHCVLLTTCLRVMGSHHILKASVEYTQSSSNMGKTNILFPVVKSYVPGGHFFPGWLGQQVCVAEPRSSSNGTKEADRMRNRHKYITSSPVPC